MTPGRDRCDVARSGPGGLRGGAERAMRPTWRGAAGALAIVLGASALVACQKPADTTAKRTVAPAERAALVNGEPISLTQVARHAEQRGSADAPVSNEDALAELVNLQLLRQEAIRRGIDREPATVEEIARQEVAVLANAMVQRYVEESPVSEEQLTSEYEVQTASLIGKEYNARHILLDDEQSAREVIAELQGGADFATLASERSTGPSASQGGDLGWFRANQMVPAFTQALLGLDVGSVTDEPVQTRFGWHVIELVGVRDVPKPAFEDVRQQLRTIVTNKRLRAFVEELREVAKIELSDSN